jgi:hypothetical protein
MRQRGKARPKQEIERAEPVHGDLLVSQQKSEIFGRYANIASFQRTGAADAELLQPLHDVVLSWMGPLGFVLTGIEVIDGVSYSQSWWCKPE